MRLSDEIGLSSRFSITVVALWVCAGTASAAGFIADVTIYDRMENRTLPVYQHNGRNYVVGKPGNEYQIRIANRSGQDILTVVSVDGVNAVSGETANWAQTGYVLRGYQGFDIIGWRKSLEHTAAFYFTEHQNSYAARTGRPNNVGVIGVAVFRNKFEPRARIEPPRRPVPPPRAEAPSPYLSESVPGAASTGKEGSADSSPAPAQKAQGAGAMQDRANAEAEAAPAPRLSTTLGTGHGRSEESPVTYTEFERASATPPEVITLHYDTYQNLLAQGVIVEQPLYARPTPTPFPGQFVPDSW